MLGFDQFVGEWRTTKLEINKIKINYTYTLLAKNPILYPLNWLFARTFRKTYIKRVVNNIKEMIQNEEPYVF